MLLGVLFAAPLKMDGALVGDSLPFRVPRACVVRGGVLHPLRRSCDDDIASSVEGTPIGVFEYSGYFRVPSLIQKGYFE